MVDRFRKGTRHPPARAGRPQAEVSRQGGGPSHTPMVKIRFISLAGFIMIAGACNKPNKGEIIPISFNGDHYETITKLPCNMNDRMTAVLRQYKVEYELKNNKLLVSNELVFDSEEVANYSAKALDDSWFKSQSIQVSQCP